MFKLHFWHSFKSDKVDVKKFMSKIKMFMAITLFLDHMLC